MGIRHLVSSITGKEIRSHHSHPPNKKKATQTKKQLLFLDLSVWSSWNKPLPQKLERQTERYKESQLPESEISVEISTKFFVCSTSSLYSNRNNYKAY